MQNKLLIILAVFSFLVQGCYKETIVEPSDVIIGMTVDPDTICADGISKAAISVELPEKTIDLNNSVTLTTNKGVFETVATNTVTVSAQNSQVKGKNKKIATVYLVSNTEEGLATVSAIVKNYLKVIQVQFTRSYPEFITISLDKANYQPIVNSEVLITTQLKRNVGKGLISSGQSIQLSAIDENNNIIGNFRNKSILLDNNGICTNYFYINPADNFVGTVRLIASAQSTTEGDQIKAIATINVTK